MLRIQDLKKRVAEKYLAKKVHMNRPWLCHVNSSNYCYDWSSSYSHVMCVSAPCDDSSQIDCDGGAKCSWTDFICEQPAG